MLSTSGSIITNGGVSLLSDAISRGVNLEFTTIKIGDGELLGGEDPKTFTNIKNLWKNIGLTSVSKTGDTVRVRGVYSNDGLETTQWVREFGVYAKTDQMAETLFCYVNDGDGENLPVGTGGNLVERVRDILAVISNATTETILDPSQVYATIYDLNEKVKAADHTMTVDASGLSANHHYILGNVFGGIIEDITDIEADKVFFSSNTKQYYRANKTASGSWTGPDSADFQGITNLELIKLINESKNTENIILHNDTLDSPTMQDNTSAYFDLRKDSVSGRNYICINKNGSPAVALPTSDFELESVHDNRKQIENLYVYKLDAGRLVGIGDNAILENFGNYKYINLEIGTVGYTYSGSKMIKIPIAKLSSNYESIFYENRGDAVLTFKISSSTRKIEILNSTGQATAGNTNQKMEIRGSVYYSMI